MIGLKLEQSAQLSNEAISVAPVAEETNGVMVFRDLCEQWLDKLRCVNEGSRVV